MIYCASLGESILSKTNLDYKFVEAKELEGKILWACAFEKQGKRFTRGLACKPEKVVVKNDYGSFYSVYGLKKNGEPKSSGAVHVWSRIYADTQEESILVLNELIEVENNILRKMIEENNSFKV